MRIVPHSIVILSPDHAPVTVASPPQQTFSEGRVRGSMFSLLQENVLCSIATVTKHNKAHINDAYFCYSMELRLYFLSDPSSLHCRNILVNPSMAMTIFNSSQKWGGSDRGIQLFGTCSEAKGHQATQAEQLYGERFRAYEKWRANESKDQPFRYRFYRFVPRKIKVLDEGKFGGGVFVIAAVRRV